jgi:hypothetical protein
MGADLYIQSINERVKAQYDRPFHDAVTARDRRHKELVDEGKTPEEATKETASLQAEVSKYYSLLWGASNEGYYRDAYNATSVLAQCGLSWWKDVGALTDEDGLLHPLKAAELIAMIEANPLHLPTREELVARHARVDDIGPNSLKGWHEYFEKERGELLAFLRRAIALNEPIRCSL